MLTGSNLLNHYKKKITLLKNVNVKLLWQTRNKTFHAVLLLELMNHRLVNSKSLLCVKPHHITSSLIISPEPHEPLAFIAVCQLVLPYLICAISPTTISATGIWITWPLRMTVNFCSCSMRLCSPRNCFSLLQSLNAVTSTTMITENRIAAPSIQPACASPSSSTPPAAWPQAGKKEQEQKKHHTTMRTDCHGYIALNQ